MQRLEFGILQMRRMHDVTIDRQAQPPAGYPLWTLAETVELKARDMCQARRQTQIMPLQMLSEGLLATAEPNQQRTSKNNSGDPIHAMRA